MLKTFWGWRDQQLPDATVIWTSPAGHTYVTTPGSALLFPSLCVPTGELPPPARTATDRCADRTAMMPKRRRTRAQHRARYIADQRRQNRQTRQARELASFGPAPPHDTEPPPFWPATSQHAIDNDSRSSAQRNHDELNAAAAHERCPPPSRPRPPLPEHLRQRRALALYHTKRFASPAQ